MGDEIWLAEPWDAEGGELVPTSRMKIGITYLSSFHPWSFEMMYMMLGCIMMKNGIQYLVVSMADGEEDIRWVGSTNEGSKDRVVGKQGK